MTNNKVIYLYTFLVLIIYIHKNMLSIHSRSAIPYKITIGAYYSYKLYINNIPTLYIIYLYI